MASVAWHTDLPEDMQVEVRRHLSPATALLLGMTCCTEANLSFKRLRAAAQKQTLLARLGTLLLEPSQRLLVQLACEAHDPAVYTLLRRRLEGSLHCVSKGTSRQSWLKDASYDTLIAMLNVAVEIQHPDLLCLLWFQVWSKEGGASKRSSAWVTAHWVTDYMCWYYPLWVARLAAARAFDPERGPRIVALLMGMNADAMQYRVAAQEDLGVWAAAAFEAGNIELLQHSRHLWAVVAALNHEPLDITISCSAYDWREKLATWHPAVEWAMHWRQSQQRWACFENGMPAPPVRVTVQMDDVHVHPGAGWTLYEFLIWAEEHLLEPQRSEHCAWRVSVQGTALSPPSHVTTFTRPLDTHYVFV